MEGLIQHNVIPLPQNHVFSFHTLQQFHLARCNEYLIPYAEDVNESMDINERYILQQWQFINTGTSLQWTKE